MKEKSGMLMYLESFGKVWQGTLLDPNSLFVVSAESTVARHSTSTRVCSASMDCFTEVL